MGVVCCKGMKIWSRWLKSQGVRAVVVSSVERIWQCKKEGPCTRVMR